jgi:hypothetical protein
MSLLIVVLATRIRGQHANLLWEVLELSCLLRRSGEDELFLRHGPGVMGCVEFFIQDLDLQGEVGGFLVELTKTGDLPSQLPVIKVFDFMLQVRKVATRPKQEGAEPCWNWFDGVFLAMPNHVSLCI